LISSGKTNSRVYTLNTHTFSQEDFDNVSEVLLCPRPLGLLEIPESWANMLRQPFNSALGFELAAPTRIVVQPLEASGWLIHNYNETKGHLSLKTVEITNEKLVNGFTGKAIPHKNKALSLTLPPRSKIWVKIVK
jgi:hypothetical protein